MYDYRKTVSASIPGDVYTELAHIAVGSGRPLSSLVRQAILEYLAGHQLDAAHQWAGAATVAASLPGQMTVDEIPY